MDRDISTQTATDPKHAASTIQDAIPEKLGGLDAALDICRQRYSIVILYFLITVDLVAMRWRFLRRNRRRDQEKERLGDERKVEENHEFQDMTDLQNREFRYAL